MRGRLLTSACAMALLVGATARAGDGPPTPDPYAAALAHARAIEQQLVATVETVSDSSVCVLNDQVPPEPPSKDKKAPPPAEKDAKKKTPVTVSIGSGVLVKTGTPGNWKIWVLTNHHVVDKAEKIEVITRDGVKRAAELADEVAQYDISLLRFTGKTDGLKAVTVRGKASVELEEGQWCLATGNPFGLAMDGRPVVTLGVITGKDRVLGGGGPGGLLYGRAIQHDAAINHGNSGGPLWNLKGEFIGINGMEITNATGLAAGQQAANSGASFSIPVDQIESYLARLVDPKKDARAGFLGLAVDTETDAKSGKPVGVRVKAVDPRSPAAGPKGLLKDDVVVSVAIVRAEGSKTYPVLTETDLVNTLSLCPAGTKVTIRYRRGGKTEPQSWTGELALP